MVYPEIFNNSQASISLSVVFLSDLPGVTSLWE